MKREKEGLKKSLSDIFELPQEMFGNTSSITVTSNIEILVNECRGVLVYELNEIQLRLCDMILKIYGSNLTLKTYFGSQISIKGKIDELKFEVSK